MEKPVQTAILGFGLSGQVFHAPFLQAHPGFCLKAIVSKSDLAEKLYPESKIATDFEEVLSDKDIELVVIATPNPFHFEHASKALSAGKHIVVEKPVTVTSEQAQQLIELSARTGCRIFPYHNRRWDGDFLTVKQIISQELLGEVLDYQAHFDRYNPVITRASWRYVNTAGGGTLFDLGIHLIDQAVQLFGKPDGVFCRLFNQRAGSIVDDSFDLKLLYPKMNASLHASVFVKEPSPRFMVHGTEGSFIKYGIDPQEAALRKGKIPAGEKWGLEPVKSYGLLNSQAGGRNYRARYKTLAGNYMAFYENVFQALTAGSPPAVKPEEAMLNIRIIEKAIESDHSKHVVPIN
jgi:predicted dehydrogenase